MRFRIPRTRASAPLYWQSPLHLRQNALWGTLLVARGVRTAARGVAVSGRASTRWLFYPSAPGSGASTPTKRRLYYPKRPTLYGRRQFSSTAHAHRQQQQQQQHQHQQHQRQQAEQAKAHTFSARLRERLRDTPVTWYPISVPLGVAFLALYTLYKQATGQPPEGYTRNDEVLLEGPWQVHVLGALPLRSLSRVYGLINSYTLPVWLRVPGYKLYAWVFGVHLDECEPSDLRQYRSLAEFFMRRLKPGVRPIADAPLVSPADGTVVNLGTVEDGRVAQVKGRSYSVDALLHGSGAVSSEDVERSSKRKMRELKPHPHGSPAGSVVDEREFADINGIHYSLDKLIGEHRDGGVNNNSKNETDESVAAGQAGAASDEAERLLKKSASSPELSSASETEAPKLVRSASRDANMALSVGTSSGWSQGAQVPRPGNKLCFCVVYLAPGDYHRFHSPASWVVEKRRHFSGELFSVSSWMVDKLADLFVLNERVALLGRWRHGFFSMVPVGATNVGSIRVNFDKTLRTNTPLRPLTPGSFTEANYATASALLGGQPLGAGDEMGGFWLGSTIVLVFEAPQSFEFNVKTGDKVRVGEALGA